MVVSIENLNKYLKGIDYKDIVTFVNKEDVYISMKQIWQLYVIAQKNNKHTQVLEMFVSYALVGEINEFLNQYGNLLRPEDKDALEALVTMDKYNLTF